MGLLCCPHMHTKSRIGQTEAADNSYPTSRMTQPRQRNSPLPPLGMPDVDNLAACVRVHLSSLYTLADGVDVSGQRVGHHLSYYNPVIHEWLLRRERSAS